MIRLRFNNPARLLWAATLVSPVLVIQAARTISSGGLSAAHAGITSSPQNIPAPERLTDRVLTPTELRARAFLVTESDPTVKAEVVRSPMLESLLPTTPANDLPPPRAQPAGAEPEAAVKLNLTGIMSGHARPLASINGRVCSVGDEIAKGWKVTEIDVQNRTVTVTAPDGHVRRLVPPSPLSH